ncbi:hypothetical protein KHC28_20710 [Ancylobacter sonchi]|uniref:hypothetical protein n=1 Tax=Ancylobacter sonchi TaxID=1937790 RepID=UPI001BD6B988|nr:hypothetical protein [Ancylobacter sonchi]MBS7536079.1 hypothetical protein [Ancylobacter sonchi]
MQSKWQALACYLGVAILCVLYLTVVPGVRLIDVCAGAGLGAAVMWAMNEWEAGRWKLPAFVAALRARASAPARPRPAAQALATPQDLYASQDRYKPQDRYAPQDRYVPQDHYATEERYAPQPRAAAPTRAASRPRPAPLPAPTDDPFVMATADPVWELDDEARHPASQRVPEWDAAALAASLVKLHRELLGERAHAHGISLDLPPGAEFVPASRPGETAPAREARVARLVLVRAAAARAPRRSADDAEPAPPTRPVPPALLRPKARRPR